MSTHAGGGARNVSVSSKSEDAIANTLDKCLADGLIKAGSGLLAGAALSLVIFRRRMWPIHMGLGGGVGMAITNCQHNLATALPEPQGSTKK